MRLFLFIYLLSDLSCKYKKYVVSSSCVSMFLKECQKSLVFLLYFFTIYFCWDNYKVKNKFISSIIEVSKSNELMLNI